MSIHLSRTARKIAVTVAALATAAVTAITLAPSASATNINTWSSFWQPCGTYLCLYYSPNLANASFRPGGTGYADLNYYTFTDGGTGTAGVGQVVGNNAASMGNNTLNCNVTAYYSANYTAPDYHYDNWLSPGWAGNLTSYLRNNERSINVNNCT